MLCICCIYSFYVLLFEVEFVPQKKAPAPSAASNPTKPKKTNQKKASGATDVEIMDMEWWESVVAEGSSMAWLWNDLSSLC